MPSYTLECGCGCGTFEAKSPRARWKTPGCKKRAQREAAGTAGADPTAGLKPEDPLVTAVRKDLAAANQLETVDGQIALHLAKQVKAATGTAAGSLAKELRQVLDRIGATPAPTPAGDQPKTAEVEDDEVTEARRRREAKAREAADRA
ncbi:hypothetical protein ASE01_20045 [Nocardioides sp. Root190]|uniref:hypothetical protein n=1 Tax=Nocardioides sp. Root190 TaxID=1736488 RepID=UPI0006FB7E3D|nr:hypothetical protein [Nocardioides sp. Root190]KRB73070.1 hypothetical protein ASE01_20045 [Nocardioides sp. Root190]